MQLSIIIPVYNEEQNIEILHNHLHSILVKLSQSYEIVFVDDGSTDRSVSVMKQLKTQDDHIKIISFRKNFGQTAALDAGFKFASGDVIITLDADLQNDPADIPRLLSKLHEGFDVVSGWRYPRKDPLSKKLFSKLADLIRKIVLRDQIHDSGCTLKAYRKEAVKDLNLFGEMHRYIPAIISSNGFSVTEIKVKHHQRKYGKTKYGIKRVFKGFLDLFYLKFWIDFSTRPLHFFGFLGIICALLGGFLGTGNVLYHVIVNHRVIVPVGPLLLLAAILVLLGIQFVVLGFLGEIIIRTYYSQSREKNYKIKEIVK